MLRDRKSIERDLEQARADLAAHQAKGVRPHECSHDWLDGMARLTDAVRKAERAVCAARGEDYAVVWQEGLSLRRAPLPRLLENRKSVTMFAVVQHVAPEWQGHMVDPQFSYTDATPVARLEFRHARVEKTESRPDDQHPLFGRGLDPARMMQIHHPAEESPEEHFLMMFDEAWIEIRGVPVAVEVWPDAP